MKTIIRTVLTGLTLSVAASLSAQTVAYWRFDDSTNLGKDSSGNGHHLTLPANSTASYSEGRMLSPRASTGYLAAPDDNAFTMNSLTLEMTFELVERTGTSLAFLAGHFYGSNNSRSYAIALDSDNQIRIALAQNNTATQYHTGINLTAGKNYYIAFAVNVSATVEDRSLTVYIKNLTDNGELLTASWTGAEIVEASLANSITSFAIGAQGNGAGADVFSGYIDEVRLSAGMLSPNELLIAIPEPSTVAMLAGLGAVAFAVSRRRR